MVDGHEEIRFCLFVDRRFRLAFLPNPNSLDAH